MMCWLGVWLGCLVILIERGFPREREYLITLSGLLIYR